MKKTHCKGKVSTVHCFCTLCTIHSKRILPKIIMIVASVLGCLKMNWKLHRAHEMSLLMLTRMFKNIPIVFSVCFKVNRDSFEQWDLSHILLIVLILCLFRIENLKPARCYSRLLIQFIARLMHRTSY